MTIILDTSPLLLSTLILLSERKDDFEKEIWKFAPNSINVDAQYRRTIRGLFSGTNRPLNFLTSAWTLSEVSGHLVRTFRWKTGDKKWISFWEGYEEQMLERCSVESPGLNTFYGPLFRKPFLQHGPTDTSLLVLSQRTHGLLFTDDYSLTGTAYNMGIKSGDLNTIVDLLPNL